MNLHRLPMKHLPSLVLLLLLFLCQGCKEEENTNFESPSIDIRSLVMQSADRCTVTLNIDLGYGFSIKKAYLQLYDLTDPDASPVLLPVELSKDRVQQPQLTVTAPETGHDYLMHACIKTKKNTIAAPAQTLYFSALTHRFEVGTPYIFNSEKEPGYPFLEDGVRIIPHPGDYFLIVTKADWNTRYSTLDVKLNNGISLRHDGNFDQGTIGAYIPDKIAPGDYTVSLYIDGEELEVEGIIRILPWSNRNTATTAPTRFYSIETWFNIDSENYIIQYADMTDSNVSYNLYAYNFNEQKWSTRQQWTLPLNRTPLTAVTCRNEAYCTVSKTDEGISSRNSQSLLYHYRADLDKWMQETVYPGEGNQEYVLFAIGRYIYMGAGMKIDKSGIGNYTEKPVQDFWRYDTENGHWQELAPVPFKCRQYRSVNSTCSDEHIAYVFLMDRTLWSYHPENDRWEQEESLRSGSFERFNSSLILYEGKVCLIGSEQSYNVWTPDVQLYDPATRQWQLMSIYHFSSYMSSAFTPPVHIHNGHIFMGPLEHAGNTPYYEMDPCFIEIIPQ